MSKYVKRLSVLIMMIVLLASSTILASSDNKNSLFVIKEKLVTDKANNIKMYVPDYPVMGSGELYEWCGRSALGYAHGDGVLKVYSSKKVLLFEGNCQFTYGKLQGRFWGKKDNEKNALGYEWEFAEGKLVQMNYKTDTLKLEYQIKNGLVSGKVFKKDADGSSTTHFLVDGKITKANIKTPKVFYEGGFNENGMNGQGILKTSNGVTYEGEFRDSKANGKGTMIFSDGSVYKGQFADNCRSGDGTLYGKNGQIIAQGLWSKDKLISAKK